MRWYLTAVMVISFWNAFWNQVNGMVRMKVTGTGYLFIAFLFSLAIHGFAVYFIWTI